jgi:hypothetical protein
MLIMTKDGWKPLEVRNCVKLVRQEYPDGPYCGPLPSSECLAFIERLQSSVEQAAARAQGQDVREDERGEFIEPTSDDPGASSVLTGSVMVSVPLEPVG